MPNVTQLFPNLIRNCRTRRGARPEIQFGKAPEFEQVLPRLATVVDIHVKEHEGRELHRVIFKDGANYGYALFKKNDWAFDRCQSFEELQQMVNQAIENIKWSRSAPALLTYLQSPGKCSSPAYITHVGKILR